MSKLLSMLVAAVFAVSTGSVFAASHAKAAGEKKEMKTEAKAEKKEMKAEKKEMKAKAKKEKKMEEKK